jgi:hypothetical protein
MSKDNLSREQIERYGRSGVQVEDTTNAAQYLTGQRSAEVTLPDGRSAGAVRDSLSKAADVAEGRAIGESR